MIEFGNVSLCDLRNRMTNLGVVDVCLRGLGRDRLVVGHREDR